MLMSEFHVQGGHCGHKRLTARIMEKYWWRGLAHDCREYVSKCVTCNRAKADRTASAPVNPLPVPDYPWEVVGVDFVTGLPPSGKNKYDAVMVVVCHLTKMAHFVPCHKEVTTQQSADYFVHEVYRLHGVPRVIVSDRGPQFIADFWQSFWRRLNTKLNMSTARRPQTDGLSERVNETMQSLLRCFCAEAGFDWASHLDMVEFAYNSSVNDAGKHSPFETAGGFNPPGPADLMVPASANTANRQADERLQEIRDTQLLVKQMLQLSKEKMADASQVKVPEYQAGDWVYVSTRGLRILSQDCRKLMDRRIGPFTVVKKIGNRSYKLNLPAKHKLHPVFHVDVLSRAVSDEPLRPRQQIVVDGVTENQIDEITDVKIDRWVGLRGPRIIFTVKWTSEPAPLPEVYEPDNQDGLEGAAALDEFMKTRKWIDFSESETYRNFCRKYPRRAVRQD